MLFQSDCCQSLVCEITAPTGYKNRHLVLTESVAYETVETVWYTCAFIMHADAIFISLTPMVGILNTRTRLAPMVRATDWPLQAIFTFMTLKITH